MTDKSFVHLHVHTDYSMLDGAAHIDELVAAAVSEGMSAIGITDHGQMFGAYDLWKQAKAAGIKPIIGIEAYLTPGTRRADRTRVRWGDGDGDDVSGSGAYTHITMLAENNQGMHNLFRLASLASMEGYYFKPRMDRELLNRYATGIIATTGCPSGEVQTRLRLGQYDEALKAAAEFRDIFGKDNYFLELMDHGLSIENRVRAELLQIAKYLSLPLLATNDLHYTHKHDHAAHDALLCVQSNSMLDDPKRFKFDGDGYYLKSAREMRELFRDLPESCDNTLLIAERCEVEFDTKSNYMPVFPVPEGETDLSWLRKEIDRGLAVRYPDGISVEVRARADFEIDVIEKMGFPSYFLVVADFINWAKRNGIRVGPGRGSGAGSMAAYAMRITDLDPLKHGLLFERFLNPERLSMPDFDVDFDERRRGEVIHYVTEKYGDDRVAQIVTFSTIKAKQALKDSARILGMDYGVGERLTKAMPAAVLGKEMSLADLFDSSGERYNEAIEFRELIDTDPAANTVYQTALGLEGMKRQWGVHAAGVIMSRKPLLDLIPMMKREQDGQIITQFENAACEDLGLLKMDLLGLRNLTMLDDAIENVKANRNEDLVLESLSLDDQPTFELMSRGDTLGVFQLDGGAMRTLLRVLKPDNFEDVSAVLALYRPGPMGANSHTNYALRKNRMQEISPIHPELEVPLAEILDPTYGLIVYQEQVMAIVQRVAGYSLGGADILRRAMGKKKPEELARQYVPFQEGMQANGFSPAATKALWDILVPFADYAFNKSHTAAYAVLSYWTGYLKANYPAEFMAALLTSVGDARDKLALYLNECRRMGIQILPPDVNESIGRFTAVGGLIRFGLTAVRNVGHNVVSMLVDARKNGGNFSSFHDFADRSPMQVVSKRTVESLIKAGAFDSFGVTRRSLLAAYEGVLDEMMSKKRMAAIGQVGFDFAALLGEGSEPQIAHYPEWPRNTKLDFEREMLGMYVSDHPLTGLEAKLAANSSVTVAEMLGWEATEDGATVELAGMVVNVKHRVARKTDKPYLEFNLEDFTGEIQMAMYSKVYDAYAGMVSNDAIAVVRGRLSFRDEVVNRVTVASFNILNVDLKDDDRPVEIRVPEVYATGQLITELRNVLNTYPGETEVRLALTRDNQSRIYRLRQRVHPESGFFAEVKSLLGANSVIR